jgi:hypothetical protein
MTSSFQWSGYARVALPARWGTLAYGVEMPALMMKQERREPAT